LSKRVSETPAGAPRGRRPWWAIAGLAAIGVLALALYTWSLSRNGIGNSYYAAAVKSATVSWKAFFFGSLDPGSFITVDKPPLAIWVMALSARLFGFSSWSILLPQALAGVASVLILHRLVRRWAGDVAALLAALAFALTPVAVLIFRYDNPDAVMTLLLLLAAWALWSAVESGSTWKLGLAGVALGSAFLTKMLMAVLVIPAFVLVHLLCAPPRLGRRFLQLLAPFTAMALSAGWWLAIVELWPDATRPYVGGTSGNSWIDLILGRTGGLVGNTTQVSSMSGEPSLLRVFNNALGGQVSWLIPLALVGLVAGLWLTRRAPRTGKARAGYVLWGLWALVTILVFGFVKGTFHSYYTVMLAPGVAALAGAGCVDLWRLSRSRPWLAWLLPVVIAGSAGWAAVLLGRVSGYASGLATAVIVVGVAASAALVVVLALPSKSRVWRISARAVPVVCLAALLAGPLAYDLSTIGRSVTGNAAAAGPGAIELVSLSPGVSTTSGSSGTGSAEADELSVDEGLIGYLQKHQGDAKYLVAVQTSAASVPIILATGEPVVTIGGYKSRDPVPTVAQLESIVAAGELHYVLLTDDSESSASSASAMGSSESTAATLQAVAEWVIARGTIVAAAEYGAQSTGTTLYFLP
jgi:4-amino-4-deoxy-L-arabinose transferase-like glycosyltransferase